MDPNSTALLTNPHPRGHLVYPSSDARALSSAIGSYAIAGLKNSEAVILILKEENIGPVEEQISAWEKHDVEGLHEVSNITYAVAEGMLTTFMIDQRPDEALFEATFRPMIERAFALGARNGHPRMVRAVGQMVSLLWEDNLPAAKQLESYWNRLIDEYPFSLLCTYALTDARRDLPAELANYHSHRIDS
jgi:hypothetical protein